MSAMPSKWNIRRSSSSCSFFASFFESCSNWPSCCILRRSCRRSMRFFTVLKLVSMPPIQRRLTKYMPERAASVWIVSCSTSARFWPWIKDRSFAPGVLTQSLGLAPGVYPLQSARKPAGAVTSCRQGCHGARRVGDDRVRRQQAAVVDPQARLVSGQDDQAPVTEGDPVCVRTLATPSVSAVVIDRRAGARRGKLRLLRRNGVAVLGQ